MPITRKKFTLPLALAAAGLLSGIPVAASAFATPAATAAAPVVYQTTLKALNGSGASGTVKISLDGTNATVTEHVSGLAAKFGDGAYPHVQHIHIDGKGACPLPSADKNDDQLVDTVEGGPSYGSIGTSLTLKGDTSPAAATDLSQAPSGASFDYSRTFKLDAKTVDSLKAGTAVVVVHGLDPSTLSEKAQGEMSNLVPDLPIAATSPALCGVLAVTAAEAPTTTMPAPAPAPAPSMPTMTPAAPMNQQPTFTG